MATLLLRRSLQRCEFSPLSSSFASLAGKSQQSSLLGSEFSSLIRPFSSRAAGNDVMGIDIMEGKNSKVIDNAEGARTAPSVVAFSQKGELLVGTPAMRPAVTNPTHTVFGTKSLFGTRFDDPQTQKEMKMGPYKIVVGAPNGGFASLMNRNTTLPTQAFSTAADKEQKFTIRSSGGLSEATILRPLSPHLPIYQPQLSSTTSIFNRISGALLTALALSFYLLYMKIGLICFTFGSFYEFLFYSSKLTLISIELAALAMAYHTFHGVRHLLKDADMLKWVKRGRR